MIKEHKFKAWDKSTNKMSQPFTFSDFLGYEGECNAVNVDVKPPFTLVTHYGGTISYPRISCPEGLNPDLELIEYTGKKDSNNSEIYEDDYLVHKDNYDKIYQVIWKDVGWYLMRVADGFTFLMFNEGESIIVGNARQNPEILIRDKAA